MLAGKLYFIFKKNICQFIFFEVDLSVFLNLSLYIYQVRNSIERISRCFEVLMKQKKQNFRLKMLNSRKCPRGFYCSHTLAPLVLRLARPSRASLARPPLRSVSRFASKTARKKNRNAPPRSSSLRSTPLMAKNFVAKKHSLRSKKDSLRNMLFAPQTTAFYFTYHPLIAVKGDCSL